MKKVILTSVAIVAMTTSALAQDGFSGFQVHAGVAFPSGDFGSENKNKGPVDGHGHAATGFNLGFKVYAPLSSSNGLSLVFGLDGFYHGLQSDYMEDDIEDVEDDGGEVTLPKYINIPLTAGLNYAHPLNDNFNLYGEFALGVNYSKFTNSVVEYEDDDYKSTTSFNSAFGFTYGLEAGILINKKINIGLRYNNFGAYKYKYTSTVERGSNEDEDDGKFDKKLPIGNLAIVLGITF
jgi:opacity protein-like surface antigen